MTTFRPRDIVSIEGHTAHRMVTRIDKESGSIFLDTGSAHRHDLCLIKPYDPKFEPGEQVECIDASSSTTLEEGNLYTVSETEERFSFCNRLQRVVIKETGCRYMAARFTKFSQDEKLKRLQQKIKDREDRIDELESRLDEITNISTLE